MNSNRKQGKPKASQSTTVKTTTKVVKNSTPKSVKVRGNKMNPLLKSYIATLNNPFENPGIPLGFGTMIGTKCATSIARLVLQSNGTDGSLTLFAYPGSDQMGSVQYLTASGVPTYASYAHYGDNSNANARTDFQSLRPVSMGVRVTPLTSANDKPVRIACGLIPYSTVGQDPGDTDTRVVIQSLTNDQIFSSHELTSMVLESGGGHCAQVTWRPQDLSSFAFQREYMYFNSASSTVTLPASGPVIAFAIKGPTNMGYVIEQVFRYEAIPNVMGLFSSSTAEARLSDYFPSVEQMWNQIKSKVEIPSLKTAADSVGIVMDAWSRSSAIPSKTLRVELQAEQKHEEVKPPPRSESRSYFS